MASLNRMFVRSSSLMMKNAARSAVKINVPAVSVRNFSGLLDKKEMAEEAKFIRSMEVRRQAEIRKNLERILALEDNHEEKQELVELLAKKDEHKGMIEKLGLDDWRYALPVGLLVGIPAVFNELIIIDAEFQLTACFALFCATMYNQVGPMLGKALDEYSNEVQKDLDVLNDTVTNQIQGAINTNNSALSLEDDFKQLYSLQDQLAVAQADVMNRVEEHKYREAIVKKLESLQALEESASSAIRNRIVTSVKSDVLTTFKTNKKAQENALDQAIAVLSGGANAKLGKDIVGEVFLSSIKTYKENYAKLPAGSDPILKQLEKDIAAVSTAPEVTAQGGNVYTINAAV